MYDPIECTTLTEIDMYQPSSHTGSSYHIPSSQCNLNVKENGLGAREEGNSMNQNFKEETIKCYCRMDK